MKRSGKVGRPSALSPKQWDQVERLFRAGIISVAEIARQFGVRESNIRHYAHKHGWPKRDLTNQVRQLTKTKIVENLSKVFKDGEDRLKQLSDENIIEEAARTQVEVIRQHQDNCSKGHKLTMRLLGELDTTTAYMGELQQLISSSVAPNRQEALRRAISLQTRAQVMKDLAAAARTWVSLERQAFSIADDKDDKDKDRKLDDMTADQLRQEILRDAKQIGLDLAEEDLEPQGVVSRH
jgi:uncharacterized protein YjcR